MVDIWCAKRETENVNSCYTRTLVIRLFIEYLHRHGQTDVLPPPVLKQNKRRRIPHAFSQEELERFFHECDSIIPCKGRMAYASDIKKDNVPRILSAPLQQWNPYNRGTALDAPQC